MARTSETNAQVGRLEEKIRRLEAEIERLGTVNHALHRSESHRLAIVAASTDAIITIDGDGIVREFNGAAERMFGYAPEQIVGNQLADHILPPSQREAHRRGLLRHIETGEGPILGRLIEVTALHADGTEFPVHLTVTPISGDPPLYTGVVRDVSEAHESRERLAEQVRLARFGRDVGLACSGASSMRDMLQRCAELMVEHLGGAFARIWLLSRSEHILRLEASAGLYTHLDGGHSRVPVGSYKIGRIAASQKPHLTNRVIGDPLVNEQEWARREGMVAFAGYPLIVETETVGVMAMFARQRLSENALAAMASVGSGMALGMVRMRVQADLHEHARALEVTDRRKDEFLAMLAHELRNPLTPIQAGLDILRLEHGPSKALRLMEEQTQHMVRLINDLLDVSRIMRGRIRLNRQPLDLGDVLEQAVDASKPLAEKRRHAVDLQLPGEPAIVDADRIRIAQVFTNLLTNAFKYTPDGGNVVVELARDDDDAVVRIADDGIGIAEEYLPEVFELFSQAERAIDRSEGGLGIGLTLAKRLVDQHGGSVEARSPGVGKGSTFTVRLPLAAPRARAGASPSPDAGRAIDTRLRVLVVDDHESSAGSIADLLRLSGGHDVRIAADGPAALALALEFAPHAILLDLGLPGMTGLEVAAKLREDERFEKTLLIAVTGYGSENDRRMTRKAGFAHHLVKPIGLEALRGALSELTTSEE